MKEPFEIEPHGRFKRLHDNYIQFEFSTYSYSKRTEIACVPDKDKIDAIIKQLNDIIGVEEQDK
jgi:hypothetical protein